MHSCSLELRDKFSKCLVQQEIKGAFSHIQNLEVSKETS